MTFKTLTELSYQKKKRKRVHSVGILQACRTAVHHIYSYILSYNMIFLPRDVFTYFIAIVIVLVTYLFYRKFTYWQRRGIKYLKPSVPFGHFGPIFMQQMSFGQLFDKLYNKTTEPVIGIYAAIRPLLMIRDPQLIHSVLVKDFQYFHDRGLYIDEKNDPMSANLVSLSGEKWKTLRAKLTPTFTSGKLKAMFSTLVDCGDSLSEYLNTATGKTIEIHELLGQYTTTVIASVAFGIDIDCIQEPNNEFRRIGRKVRALKIMGKKNNICFFYFLDT